MGIAKLLGGLASLMCAGLLVGMPAAPVQPAGAAEQTASQRVGLQRTGPGTFSIDVDGADVRSVMRAIAEFSGRNIIVAREVKATVSVSLQNVNWRDALRTILYSANLDYEEEGDIIRVDDRNKLANERNEKLLAISKQMENAPDLEQKFEGLATANTFSNTVSILFGMHCRPEMCGTQIRKGDGERISAILALS